MPTGVYSSTGLSITNPLVLYRALVATRQIKPDPAQHRLALHLQKLYFRLKDYSPEIEYRTRIDQISRTVPPPHPSDQNQGSPNQSTKDHCTQQRSTSRTGYFQSLFSRAPSSILALTRTTPLYDSAVHIASPQGLLLYGEVGRGKSMLLDLLYSSLPSRKKRRWHFNTFMLDVFRRLEKERIYRTSNGLLGRAMEHEHVVLSLAKDTIATSPILFLDEFQMPDRTSSKLVNGFMTAFFHLGGVLVASSNRMPDELAKASGVEFGRNMLGTRLSAGQQAAKSDFGIFLDVLKARCEAWEMEGERDWRREGDDDDEGGTVDDVTMDLDLDEKNAATAGSFATQTSAESNDTLLSSDTPRHYHIFQPSEPAATPFATDIKSLNPSATWIPTTLTVYSRPLVLPTTNPPLGLCLSSFSALCGSNLGPADYITLCSHFHTLIVTEVPVLTLLQKNEARRFITFLDALYEAKCRLVLSAEAPPDKLFFPETRRTRASGLLPDTNDGLSTDPTRAANTRFDETDSIESEAFSEMYQDTTAPFRPNISMYDERHHSPSPTTSPSTSHIDTSANPTFSLHNRQLRSVLADEDADFGPTYGNGRSHGMSVASSADELRELETLQSGVTVDFTNLSALTGEDERFAYKRAKSRLWEMCGGKWWRERQGESEAWWRPVDREADGRFWEGTSPSLAATSESANRRGVSHDSGVGITDASHDGRSRRRGDAGGRASGDKGRRQGDESGNTDDDGGLFKYSASPFRTVSEPPPKFGWQHAWGMMKWGRKAGDWGKGVEGEGRRTSKRDDVVGDKMQEEEGGKQR